MRVQTQARRRLILSGAAAFAGLTALAAAPSKERVIKVIAKKFKFVPEEIKVRRGEAVVLHFTAPEVFMGVSFADFKQRIDIVPGKVATLRLAPEQAGSFVFLCDVFCGSGHEEMSGTLVVS